MMHLHSESLINSSIRQIELVVGREWRLRNADLLAAHGWQAVWHDGGDALADALARSWEPVDLVVLDLALATPALRRRLPPDGPRLLAFGDAEFAGVALDADLADFLSPDADEAALLAAIAAAVAPAAQFAEASHRLGRLGSLTAEAARIADALARFQDDATGAAVSLDPVRLRQAIRARRARDRFFPAELFGEPAWDMLLDLALAAAERRDVAVSSLCIAAAVPTTTALRWIRTLCDAGLFDRRDDPADARRAFISLSAGAQRAMARYLAQTAQPWL